MKILFLRPLVENFWVGETDGDVKAAPLLFNRAYIHTVWIPVYLANYREGVKTLHRDMPLIRYSGKGGAIPGWIS